MMIILLVLLAEKPDIQYGPEALYRVIEGQNVIIPCGTFGVPTPKVYWSKRDRIITGGRYVIN
jgi:hypothetical protein